jgi:regulator of sigma E protease
VATTVNSPADQAEIPLEAQIVSIDGQGIHNAHQMRQVIRGSGGRALEVEYRNPGNGNLFKRIIKPVPIAGVYRLGIATVGGDLDVPGSLGDAVTQDRDAIVGTFAGFLTILTGHIPGGIGGACGPSGPVGIVRATAAAAQAGWVSLLQFMAFLSVNLGILNLLPLPALDGGRLAFLAIEGVRRKPIDPAKEQRVHYVGLLVLLAFVVFISYNDFVRLGIPFDRLLNQCAG